MTVKLASGRVGLRVFQKMFGNARSAKQHSTLTDFTQWMKNQKIRKPKIQFFNDSTKNQEHHYLSKSYFGS